MSVLRFGLCSAVVFTTLSCGMQRVPERAQSPSDAETAEDPSPVERRRAYLTQAVETHVLVVDDRRIPPDERLATVRGLDLSKVRSIVLHGAADPVGRELIGDEEDMTGAIVLVTSGNAERGGDRAPSESGRPATRNQTAFPVRYISDHLRDAPWVLGGEDAEGDGRREGSQDGRELRYWLDPDTDTLWVRLAVHGEIDEERPAVSLSFDLDDDQGTGMAWYGSNTAFHYDQMVSVGPVRREEGRFVGYNGITDLDGVRRRDWINVRQGNVAFLLDPAGRSYVVGVALSDLGWRASRVNFIGSVGRRALWNDDLIDEGHVTITPR